MFRLISALLIAFCLTVPLAHAQVYEVESSLAADESREFPVKGGPKSEKTVFVDEQGSHVIVDYSSSAPIEIWVSFPFFNADSYTVNPLHILKAKNLQAIDRAVIAIDLTGSPAWSPLRSNYILHVRGYPESVVNINQLSVRPSTPGGSLAVLIEQLFMDEPVLLSSVNFLWGYRVWNVNLSVILGVLVFISVGVVTRFSKRKLKAVLLICAVAVFLYDARYNLDLLRVSAKDLKQWYSENQYRQLGPVHEIAEYLKKERLVLANKMEVAVCFDGSDFLLKQLRYMLYPTRVMRLENMESATHVVIIDTDRGGFEEDKIRCGEDLVLPAELLKEFPQQSSVHKLLNP